MSQEQVTVVAIVQAQRGAETRVREALLAAVGPTRRETGCLNYDLHESLDDPCLFVFHENWTSRAALDAHLATPHLEKLRRDVEGLLAAPPRIDVLRRIKA